MREPYGEGLAAHTGPESCVGAREGVGEALTGVHAGWVLSRERICIRGADPVGQWGRPHGRARIGERPARPRVVEDPRHAWKLFARKPGDLPSGRSPGRGGPHRKGRRGCRR
jgi:hypothetical protein